MRHNKPGVVKSDCFRDVTTMHAFEDWSISEGAGWYGLASAFVFAGIEDGMYVRVPAAVQKKLFGRVMFGKQAIQINPRTGTFQTITSQAFGGDYDVQEHWPAHYYIKDGVYHKRTTIQHVY